MIDYLQNFLKTVAAYPERTAVVDKDGERNTTYKRLDELSGRVASFLKKKGFQKEDLIAIHLEKSMEYLAVELGAMKLGAAYVPLSDSMGQERITHMLEDSGAKLLFDAAVWKKAMEYEPLSPEEWADSDEHDLAFVIYTSGSTGKPKGVVEEYGAYRFITAGTALPVLTPYHKEDEGIRFANVAPVTFSAFNIISFSVLYFQGTVCLVSATLLKNPALYVQYLVKNRIEIMFLTASLVKTFSEAPNLSLKAIALSSERVSNVFSKSFDILNLYCNTELMSTACLFKLDKSYPNTPIGNGCTYTDMLLLDDGKVSEKEGEISLYLPYFRGYLHMPEETEKSIAYIQGKRFYRTGDIARRGEDGLLYVLGRADDMVKIRGNRVEPAEIEEALKKVLETNTVAVKHFERGGNNYLCAYYQKESALPPEEIATRLKPLLPAYMIPSHFVRMNKIPLNSNGKIDKKNLPLLDFIFQNPYIPPRTECEKKLCKAFKEVLEEYNHIEKIGIDDDFFLMGGDSVSAMELMLACEDLKLTVPLIHEKRTVRAIAEAVDKARLSGSESLEKETQEEKLPLILSQKGMLDYEANYSDSLVDNIPVIFTLQPDIDEKKLYEALQKVIASHPALRTVLEKDKEQGYVQYQKRDIDEALSVEIMTEQELAATKKSFGLNFTLDGSPLFRCCIIRTEKQLVLLLECHHAIIDGHSLHIFASELQRAYKGEALTTDNYTEFVKESLEAEKNRTMLSLEGTHDARVILPDGSIYYCAPAYDLDEANKAGSQKLGIPFEESIAAFCSRHAVSQNDFYLFATALSLALYNDCDKVAFDWIWNGRDSVKYANTIGYFLKELFISLELPSNNKVYDSLIICKNKAADSLSGIKDAAHTMIKADEERVCFIFQGSIYAPDYNELITDVEWLENQDRAAESIMDIEVMKHEGGTEVSFDYDGGKYRSESIAAFIKLFAFCCQMILQTDENANLTIGEMKKQWRCKRLF